MTTVFVSTRIGNWLNDRLAADTTLGNLGTPKLNTQTIGSAAMRLYEDGPPQASAVVAVVYPLVVFGQQDNTPDECLDGEVIGASAVYLVKVIGAPGQTRATLEPIMDEIGVRLAPRTTETVGGWTFTVLGWGREISYIDPTPGGPRYRHLGRLVYIAAEPV